MSWRHDIDLLLIADDEQADKHGYMRMVQGRRVDALIVAHTLDDDPRLAQLQASGFPFLALGRSRRRSPTPGLISITMPAPAAPPAI